MGKGKIILIATAVAGTLDLLSAFLFGGMKGQMPLTILQFVASGPLGDRALAFPAYAAAGLITHYAIMTIMVLVYVFAAERMAVLVRHPLLCGAAYGLGLWIVMYWVVRPLRWPDMPLPTAGGVVGVTKQLISHVLLVGIPIGLVVARGLRRHSG